MSVESPFHGNTGTSLDQDVVYSPRQASPPASPDEDGVEEIRTRYKQREVSWEYGVDLDLDPPAPLHLGNSRLLVPPLATSGKIDA